MTPTAKHYITPLDLNPNIVWLISSHPPPLHPATPTPSTPTTPLPSLILSLSLDPNANPDAPLLLREEYYEKVFVVSFNSDDGSKEITIDRSHNGRSTTRRCSWRSTDRSSPKAQWSPPPPPQSSRDQKLVKAPSSTVAAPTAANKVAQAETSGNADGGIDDDLQASFIFSACNLKGVERLVYHLIVQKFYSTSCGFVTPAQGGLPCKLEGILEPPVINGYRNKCEFSVGYSLEGKRTVGFMLGNFREGMTAIEEPVNCPNVSGVSSKYASIFQDFLQSSALCVWSRADNTGFWRQFTVREGRNPGLLATAENAEIQIAEVMLIIQLSSAQDNSKLKRLKRSKKIVSDASSAHNIHP